MIYLFDFEDVYGTGEMFKIKGIHYKPFDDKHGFGKTKEELLKKGFLVESIPEKPRDRENEVPVLHYVKSQDKLMYRYEPKTKKEGIKEKIEKIESEQKDEKEQQEAMQEAIDFILLNL